MSPRRCELSYAQTVGRIAATWWLGLTATPPRRDGLEQITSWHVGPIRHVVREVASQAETLFTQQDDQRRELFVHESTFEVAADFDVSRPGAMAELGKTLAFNERRNAQIVEDVFQSIENKRKCLVLTRRRDHLSELAKLMTERGIDPLVMQGGATKKELAAIRIKIAEVNSDESLLILTTVPYAGEGFDLQFSIPYSLPHPCRFPAFSFRPSDAFYAVIPTRPA